jgi:ComF family protein
LLETIDGAACGRCGAPLAAGHHAADGECIQCVELSFQFGRNVSLGIFDGRLRNLIHAYKFEGRWSLHRIFAALLYGRNRTYIECADVITAVPLSSGRYVERGYNQSFLLAGSVARLAHVHFMGRVIKRKGHAAPQSSISSRQDRITNLSDTFTARTTHQHSLRHKRILLVDDVLTTGVTASACARALMRAGALSVNVLTIARALKGAAALYLSSNRPIMK